MYTLKFIVDGDTHLRDEKNVTLSRFGGRGYKDAMNLVEESKNIEFEAGDIGDAEIVKGQPLTAVPCSEIQGTTPDDAPMYEISAVELVLTDDARQVLCASRRGNRDYRDAIGVVMTDLGLNDTPNGGGVRYEFVYGGDEVYVVNSEGKTIASVR